jgi:hypothetical protein
MWLVKIALIIALLFVFFQDYKDRLVSWFLYPMVGILALTIQIQATQIFITMANVVVNLAFVLILIVVAYSYAKIKFKKHFTQDVLGIGDILFFIFISFSFSSISFIVLFVFALLFSLLLHLFLSQKSSEKTVPLAGYMSLFFGFVYALSFVMDCTFLYAY